MVSLILVRQTVIRVTMINETSFSLSQEGEFILLAWFSYTRFHQYRRLDCKKIANKTPVLCQTSRVISSNVKQTLTNNIYSPNFFIQGCQDSQDFELCNVGVDRWPSITNLLSVVVPTLGVVLWVPRLSRVILGRLAGRVEVGAQRVVCLRLRFG